MWDGEGMAFVTPAGHLARFGAGGSAMALRTAFAEWTGAGTCDLTRLRIRLRPGRIVGANWLQRRFHSLTVEPVPGPRR